MPKARLDSATAAGTGIHLVSEVSRKPRKTVSSSSGARKAVVAMREAYVEKSMVIMEDTAGGLGRVGSWGGVGWGRGGGGAAVGLQADRRLHEGVG